jgi:hypothetical protein
MNPFRVAFLAIAIAIALCGCDAESLAIAPAAGAACAAAGDRCQLEKGPIGICERTPCEAGEAGACFHCSPQH